LAPEARQRQNITSAKAEISAAISIIRQAYDSLLNPNAKPLTDEEKGARARRQNMGSAPQVFGPTGQLSGRFDPPRRLITRSEGAALAGFQ
jgi:hypothetical protein